VTDTLSVQRNLELLGRYRYLEIQMLELMGSWAYTMVDPEIKIGFGRQIFQDAVHADLLGKRIPELKGRSAHFHSIPPSDRVIRVIEDIWKAEGDLKRMVGLHRVLKPALIGAYREHMAMAEIPADEPTAYILHHILDEEQDHCAWGEKIIARLGADPGIGVWEKELAGTLREAGGPAGRGNEQGTYSFAKVHAYSTLPVRDSRWDILRDPAQFTEKNWSFDTQEGKQRLLHDLLNSEFITVERMGRILADFPDIPWQMKLDMARQAWDEARHAEIVQRRLEELGGHVGMFKTSCWGWEQDVNRPDPLERLALSNNRSGQLWRPRPG
jgi:bacterioferritin (cytochrome b1)